MSSFKDKLAMFNKKPENDTKKVNKIETKNQQKNNVQSKSGSKDLNNKSSDTKNINNKENKRNIIIETNKKSNENGMPTINKKNNNELPKNLNINTNKKEDTKNLKEETEMNDKEFLNSNISKIGMLINGKHPIYGSVKIEEIKGKTTTLEIYNYPMNIEYSSKEQNISILFVGQSGTGKSTFINAFTNHLLGISMKDNIRYKLILGDKAKEKDQTQSQTDTITIYYVRSLLYNNKLFKLIDTPGAGDTRNDNENQISKIEKDKKEKEFLVMYNKLFSEDIGQLNSITFVIKASENRENEFQKKIIKNITDLFAGDIGSNSLAILTHTDDDEMEPNAVQLLQKIDFFAKKYKNNEEFYFPVSSTSYFSPFKKDSNSMTKSAFIFTENAFKSYTKKLLTLKILNTKKTQKNLQLKDKQEKIIKILKTNILDNLFAKLKELSDNDKKLKVQIDECKNKEKEIDDIKKEIIKEEETTQEIKNNLEAKQKNQKDIEKKIKETKDKINSLNDQMNSLNNEINDLETQKTIAENEKNAAIENQKNLNNKILELQKQIETTMSEIKNKKEGDEDKEKKLKELELSLKQSNADLQTINNQIEEKQKMKKEFEEKKKNAINSKNNLQLQINNKEKEKNDLNTKMKDEEKRQKEILNAQLKKLEEEEKKKLNSINEEKQNLIKEKEKEMEKLINKIKNDIQAKIDEKKKEKEQLITEKYKVFTDDDKTNLTCKKCQENCHLNCDCNYLVFWKPVLLCSIIQDGKCTVCKHEKNEHERIKKYYKEKEKKRPLSPNSKQKIDYEIKALESNLNLEMSNTETQYKQEIEQSKVLYENKKKIALEEINKQRQSTKINNNNISSNAIDDINKISNDIISNVKEINKKEQEIKDIDTKISEIKKIENEKKEKEEKAKKELEEKKKLEKEMNEKNKAINKLEDIVKNNQDQTNLINQQLKNIKIDENQNKINLINLEKVQKDKDLQKTQEELEKLKNDLNEEKEIEKIKSEVNAIADKLNSKIKLIESKKNDVINLTTGLEQIYKAEKIKLEKDKKKIEKELQGCKNNTIRQFLIIKIINQEIGKLTLNQSTISPVNELINELSLDKKFLDNLDNRKYFQDIVKEFENELNESDAEKLKLIYKKYEINIDSITKIQ